MIGRLATSTRNRKVQSRERRKVLARGKRRKRQKNPYRDCQARSDRQGKAGTAVKGVAYRANHKQDQRLRGQRPNKPAGMKQRLGGMKDRQHSCDSFGSIAAEAVR